MRDRQERGIRPVSIVWLVALVWAIGGVVALHFMVHAIRPGESVPVGTLAGVERLTALHFPQGTVLIDAAYNGGQLYPRMLAVLRMPRESVEDFFEAAPFSGQTSATERAVTNEHARLVAGAISGWHPDGARQFTAATICHPDTSHCIEVLADLEGQEPSVVYLVWTIP